MKNLIYSSLLISSFFSHAVNAGGNGALEQLSEEPALQKIARNAIRNNYKDILQELNPKVPINQSHACSITIALEEKLKKLAMKTEKRLANAKAMNQQEEIDKQLEILANIPLWKESVANQLEEFITAAMRKYNY
ncbi:MAG TPA: hypothetical protein VMW10_03955 [Alphaproteobacteria bacterium]|nr:hypothetical protein [Alphaproteobacteria bacterium]